MSLEQIITRNNQLLERNNQLLESLLNNSDVASLPESKQATKPEVKKPAAKAKPTTPEPIAEYADAAAWVTKVLKNQSKEVAKTILAEFGLTKLPEAKPEQFADIIDACKRTLGE